MSPSDPLSRRNFLNQSLAVAGTAGVLAGTVAAAPPQDGSRKEPGAGSSSPAAVLPCGTLGRRQDQPPVAWRQSDRRIHALSRPEVC